MFWFAPPPKRDSLDKIIESEGFQANANSDAALFWARRRKAVEPEVREAMIQEARIKYLHAGGKP